MDNEKDILMKSFETNRAMLKLILELSFEKPTKLTKTSERHRKNGNEYFKSKKHDMKTHLCIFNSYTKSIATAANNSESMALAYENKSAFLLHMEKYEECIKDIDRTLSFTKSHTLKIKLLCCKVECMKKLGSHCHSAINDAKRYLNDIKADEVKAYSKLIEKAEALQVSENNEEETQKRPVGWLPEETSTVGFSIQNNEEDGRYLIASKDYEPGDVIFVESPFVTTESLFSSSYLCQYCWKYCWSSVPCDKCSRVMFCSEDCKKNAWQEFHDVECSLVPYLNAVDKSWHNYYLSIQTLIVRTRIAGGIAELKDELKSVNEGTDLSFKGYIRKGKFESDSIQNLFLLNSNKIPDDQLESMCLLVFMTLIGLVRHTCFSKDIYLESIDDLIKNEDLIFLGSLLLKLMVIQSENHSMLSTMMSSMSYEQEKKAKLNIVFPHTHGSYFSPLTSLLKHSCMPNAAICVTEDKKMMVYATCPIENNSQIFVSHIADFDKVSLKERKERLESSRVVCNCQACQENWPPIYTLSKKVLKKCNYAMSTDVEKEVYKDCKSILDAVYDAEADAFTEKDIEKLSRGIKRAISVKYPSHLVSLLIDVMKHIYVDVYGWKEELLKDCTEKVQPTKNSSTEPLC